MGDVIEELENQGKDLETFLKERPGVRALNKTINKSTTNTRKRRTKVRDVLRSTRSNLHRICSRCALVVCMLPELCTPDSGILFRRLRMSSIVDLFAIDAGWELCNLHVNCFVLKLTRLTPGLRVTMREHAGCTKSQSPHTHPTHPPTGRWERPQVYSCRKVVGSPEGTKLLLKTPVK
jgi:hypothetical protein